MSFLTYPLNYIDYDYEDVETWLATRNSGVFVKNDFAYKVAGTNTQITFGEGLAWIHNHKFAGKVFKNDSDFVIDFGASDATYDRIDVAAIQFDKVANTTRIVAKHGEAKTNPVIPAISQTEELYELYICSVRRKAGSVYITDGDVSDLRLSEYCGLMADNVTSIDTAAIYAQVMDLIYRLEEKIKGVESSAEIMLKSVYDTDNDGIVDNAKNAQKLGGKSPEYYATDSAVQTAQDTADTAKSKAQSAQSTANNALTTSTNAKNTADAANSAANTALNVANGKVSIKQIYLNTNYAAAFPEQTLAVGEYSMYIVEFKPYTVESVYEHITVIVYNRTKAHGIIQGNSAIISRSVEKVSGGLKFYGGYLGSTADNSFMIPFTIWGVNI